MKKTNLLIAASIGFTLGCQTSCVAAGSMVLTETGWRPIESLVVGDEIISVCEKSGRQESSQILVIRKATREVGSVSIEGKTLLMTSDHPVYDPIENIYAPAGDWFSGKRSTLALYADENLKQQDIDSREMFVKLSDVFDLTVESELHNFIAEGILVHNKSPIVDDVTCEKNGTTYQDGQSCAIPGCASARISCRTASGFFGDVAECACEDLRDMGDVWVEPDTFSCVAAGSLVLTKDGLRPIEDLRVGDEIISVNEETSETESSPIVFIKKATREVGSVELNGKTLCMTSDHPVYDPIEGVYAPAGDWFTGERTTLAMLGESKLDYHEVEERSLFVKMSDVFDLTVASDFHNFIAEGILVHNKQPPWDVSYPDTGYYDTGYNDTGYYDTGYNDTGYSDTGYNDTGYADAGDTGPFEPPHEHCGNTCPDGICTGTDGNLSCVRDSIGCDLTFLDQRDDCDVEFACNDGEKPTVSCDKIGGNYSCQCEVGNLTARFKLGVCPSTEYLLDEINAHCATRYSIQP